MQYENEQHFCEAIEIIAQAVENYDFGLYGYTLAEELAPKFNFGASAKTGAKMAVPVK